MVLLCQFVAFCFPLINLSQEGYVCGRAGVFVCLYVCPQHYLQSNERIRMCVFDQGTIYYIFGKIRITFWIQDFSL